MDVQKDRILVIGDSMTSDMQLAKNAGVDCCLYDPAKTERKAGASTYVIDHLSQLEAFYGKGKRTEIKKHFIY